MQFCDFNFNNDHAHEISLYEPGRNIPIDRFCQESWLTEQIHENKKQ